MSVVKHIKHVKFLWTFYCFFSTGIYCNHHKSMLTKAYALCCTEVKVLGGCSETFVWLFLLCLYVGGLSLFLSLFRIGLPT